MRIVLSRSFCLSSKHIVKNINRDTLPSTMDTTRASHWDMTNATFSFDDEPVGIVSSIDIQTEYESLWEFGNRQPREVIPTITTIRLQGSILHFFPGMLHQSPREITIDAQHFFRMSFYDPHIRNFQCTHLDNGELGITLEMLVAPQNIIMSGVSQDIDTCVALLTEIIQRCH